MMKKVLFRVVAVALTTLFFASCMTEKEFDAQLLYGGNGRWVHTRDIAGDDHSIYQRFQADGTGYEWDTTADVLESEAQNFKWTLEGSTLTYVHQDKTSGQYLVPERYTVLELSASALRMQDKVDGITYVVTKVN